MSKLNQLVSDCFVKLVVWLAEDTDISLTQLLCYREREIETVRSDSCKHSGVIIG